MKLPFQLLLIAATVAIAPLCHAQAAGQPASQTEAAATPDQSMAQSAPADASTRLAAIVPPGLTPQAACDGFKSLTDCSAALHASQNLNIPFPDVKGKVTSGKSLAAAIKSLRPEADASKEEKRAEQQAAEDLHPSG